MRSIDKFITTEYEEREKETETDRKWDTSKGWRSGPGRSIIISIEHLDKEVGQLSSAYSYVRSVVAANRIPDDGLWVCLNT